MADPYSDILLKNTKEGQTVKRKKLVKNIVVAVAIASTLMGSMRPAFAEEQASSEVSSSVETDAQSDSSTDTGDDESSQDKSNKDDRESASEDNNEGSSHSPSNDIKSSDEELIKLENIFQIQTGYVFEDGSFDVWTEGAAFLVNDQYVVTDKHLAYCPENSEVFKAVKDSKGKLYAEIGVDLKDYASIKKNIKSFVIAEDGHKVLGTIEVKANSETSDFSVLELNESLPYTTSSFSEEKRPSTGDEVYIPGFDGEKLNKAAALGHDDMVVKTVTITDSENADMSCITYTGDSDNGQVGSPVYDDSGLIVGLNTEKDGETGCIVPLFDIKQMLDNAGISYSKEEGAEIDGDENLNVSSYFADSRKLIEILQKAESYDEAQYTPESYEALRNAMESGRQVAEDRLASQESIDQAVNNIEEAIGGLQYVENESKLPFDMALIKPIAICGSGLLVVLTLLILFIKALKRKGNKKKEAVEDVVDESEDLAKLREQYQNKFSSTDMDGYDSGEEQTTFLDQGTEETTLLSGAHGRMQRKSTGEMFDITSDRFIIGKERKRVDFCIDGNTSVSRQHAFIISNNGKFYIEDNNSTNATYLNGKALRPHDQVELKDRSLVKIADEDFVFYME
ncbi:MAG: FHA domain-containing protein [Eubacterium sp.]|nr:FHA domain-containing protein [Eubacterium sp.]